MSSSIAADTATPRMASSVRLRCRVSVAQARRKQHQRATRQLTVPIVVAAGQQLERRHADEPARRGEPGDQPEHQRQRHREQRDVRRDERERERRAIHAAIVPVDDQRRRPSRAPSPTPLPTTATTAASTMTDRAIERAEMPISRSAATSRRRSSTLSSMMQSRKIALATIVITPIAR